MEKLKYKLTPSEWKNTLENYIHPIKKTKVKKVTTIVSEGTLEYDSNSRKRIGEFVDFGTKGTNHQFKHSKGHKGQILYYSEKGSLKVMPIYSNKKTQDVISNLKKSGYKLYKAGMIFYSGCLVEVDSTFEASVYYKVLDENGKEKLIPKKETLPAGIYKLRTLKSNGAIKIENNSGIEILTSAKNLTDANFSKLES